jgi:hypothetical protein
MSLTKQTIDSIFHKDFIKQCFSFHNESQSFILEDGIKTQRGYVHISTTVRRKSKRIIAGHCALLLKLEKVGKAQWFKHFAEEKCADFGLLLHRHKGSVSAFVIECKETLDATEWEKAKIQLGAMIVRLRSVVGAINVRLHDVTCYTAFRRDPLSDKLVASRRRKRVGQPRTQAATHRDWLNAEIELGQLGRFAHRKIELDQQGKGTLRLSI